MPLLPGKLPVRLLQQLLRFRGASDRRVVLGPAFGQDAAVIDLGQQYLILKSDPVTFTTEDIGWYAVHVNANDVAVMGARPAWFQSTIIVPPRTAPGTVRRIFRDIDRSARKLGIAVTGGHTEVSPAVNQPIVAGDMQGLVKRGGLVTAAGAQVGDRLILTKFAGIEGTSIIASSQGEPARHRASPRPYFARRQEDDTFVVALVEIEDGLVPAFIVEEHEQWRRHRLRPLGPDAYILPSPRARAQVDISSPGRRR
jgi:hydrogenase maturation factor